MDLAAITTLRRLLWEAAYRPIPLLSHDDPDLKRAGKAPIHHDWILRALRNPPEAARTPAQQHLRNTGILLGLNGLLAVDIDIDNAARAGAAEEIAIATLWPAPTRRRGRSRRCAMLYRLDGGTPHKHTLRGSGGCVEVLGHGQQLAAYGIHASGAELEWSVDPIDLPVDHLPTISKSQLNAFLDAVTPVIGANPARLQRTGNTRRRGAAMPDAELARVASALAAIPADDYALWIRIGAALHAITAGSASGLILWDEWSSTSAKYRAEEMAARWASFDNTTSHNRPGAGTIFHLARQHGWTPPLPEPPADWLAAHPPP
jgi:hypothetical protein